MPARYLLAWRRCRLLLRWRDPDRSYGSPCLRVIKRESDGSLSDFARGGRSSIAEGGAASMLPAIVGAPSTGSQRKQCAQKQQTKRGEPNRSRHRNHFKPAPSRCQRGARFQALKWLSGGSSPSPVGCGRGAQVGAKLRKAENCLDPPGKSGVKSLLLEFRRRRCCPGQASNIRISSKSSGVTATSGETTEFSSAPSCICAR